VGNHRLPGVVLGEIRFKWQGQSRNYNISVAFIRLFFSEFDETHQESNRPHSRILASF